MHACCWGASQMRMGDRFFRFEVRPAVSDTKDGSCYRCLYPERPPGGRAGAELRRGRSSGLLPGLVGVIQATEDDQADLVGEPVDWPPCCWWMRSTCAFAS